MKVNGKSKTPITAAQAQKKSGDSGGNKARTSQQASKKKLNGVKTAVLERISDGILAFDAGMNYTYLNERAGELLGRSAEELIGKNLREAYSGADRTPFMEACQRALETQSVVWLNEYFPPTDRWLEGRIYPSEDGVSVLFSEGAGQKSMEAEGTLRAIVNQSSAGITRTDLEGRYTFVNQAFCDMLGYSEQELTRMSIWEVTDEKFREKNRRLFEHSLSRGEGYQIEKRMVRHNGSLMWVSVGASPLRDTDGRVIGTTAVIVDITRRKRAEESLLDTARRSLFLSSLSDTLRSFDTPAKIETEAACLLGAHLKASRVAYAQVDPDGYFQVLDGYVNEVPQLEGVLSIADLIPQDQLAKLQAGRLFTMQDVEKDARIAASQRSTLEKLAIRAQMVLPFIADDRVIAVLLIQQDQSRKWKDEEISLVEEAAERLQAATERARAEARLRDSEKRFRILANAVPSIVWTSTREGQLLYVNDRWYDFTGVPRQESTPLWTDLKLHPEDAADFFQEMRAVKSRQVETVAEVRLQGQDGLYRWFQTRSVPTIDENGMITVWHGVLTDIHDRVEKDAEQRKVFDSTPFMLTRCSRDLRYQFVSRAYAEMIGMKPEQLIGSPIAETVGEKGLETIRPYVERVLQGERMEFEDLVPFASGNTPYLHVTFTPDRDEQGDVIGWFASIIDITERRQMEESLRESERKFNIIFHKLPFTALLLRPEDNVIVDANEEFETVFGFTRQEILGRTTAELGIESDPQDRAHILADLQANVAIRDMELQFNSKMRGLRTFLINTDMVDIGGSEYILQTAQDITERRQAEQEAQKVRLQAEHENLQLKALLENLPVGVMLTDMDGTPLLMNPALDKIWQGSQPLNTLQDYTAYRAWDMETGNLLDPEDWPVTQALQTGEPQAPKEIRIERFDGTQGTMLSAAAPIRDRTGRIIRAVAVAQDITERKQIEQSLAREREMFKRLFETMPVMATIYEPETGTLRMNAEFERLTGWKQEESDVTSVLQGLYPDPDYMKEILGRMAAAAGTKEWVEVRIHTRAGRTLDNLWTNISLMEGEKIITGISLGIDITERKQAEAALRASEEKYRRIVETANEGIWEIDKDTKTIFANNRMAEMLGYTVEEMLGRSAFEFVFTEDRTDGENRLERAKDGTGSRSREFKFRRKDGSSLWVLLSNSPRLDEQGNFLGSTAMIMDITERKRAEAALRTSEERMRLAIESNRMVAWEWDPQADLVTTSDNLSEVYGLSSVSNKFEGFSLIRPEDLPAHREKVDQVMRTGGEYRSEFRVTRPVDGRTLWLEERAIALAGPDGQVTRLVGVVIDITERKRAEQELAEFARQQQALYKLADQLSSAGSLEEMFNPALDAILNALQCDRASILLFDQQDVMSFVAWRGLSENYRRATNGHSPWTRGEKNARPISMDDIATADLSASLRATIQAEGIGALAFIPLINRGNLIGKFMVYFDQPHAFDETEVSLAQTIAHQLASQIERKRSAEELRQSKQRLSLTYHHAPIGIVETTLEGRFLEVNNEFCNMLGYSYDELIKLGIADVTDKDDQQAEMELYRQLAKDEIPFYRMEKRFVKKDGTRLWGEIVRTMLHDENGRPLYGIGGILNIEERKQKEEELRARTEEIEALMDVSPIGIFFAHDPECSMITGSPSAYHLVEMPEDSTGNVSKSAPEHERPTYRVFRNGIELKAEELPMQMAARLGIEIEEETLELRFENGVQKYIYAYAKPLFDMQGKVRGAIASMLDITERRRNEQALRESEERFAQFMQHFPGHAWIKDLQGRYIYANAAVFKTHNLTAAELYGKTDREIFPEAVAAEFISTDEMALVEEKGTQVVQQSQQENQTVGHSLITKFPIPGPDGRPALIGGTALDITERIQMEEALRGARVQAEKTAYRMTQLQKITAAISQAVTPTEIARMVVEQGAPVLGAIGSSIMLLNEESHVMEMIYSSVAESIARSFASIPLSSRVPTTDAVQSAQPVWIPSREEYLNRYPNLAEQVKDWGFEAALAFPMIYKGRVLGTLSLSFDRPMPFSREDQEYLLTLARQAAQAFERARVETALRLDAAMMENVPAGIYLVRASDGTILHTNPQLDKLFGYEPGEVIGKPVSLLNAENLHSPQEVADEIIDILRKNGSWQGEILSRRKEGKTFWCYATITSFQHDTYGTVWVAARQDISERKQIEAALSESEQRYRAIVSQATAGIVRKDRSGRLLFVNQAFCDMLGMAESELIGRRIWELTYRDDVGENKLLYDRLMADGVPFQFEKRLLHHDGSILWTNVSVSPVIGENGKINSAVSVYVDITGRKQAEGRLALLTTVNELVREFEDPDELMFAVAQVVGEHFQVRRALFNEIDLENDQEIVHRDYCREVESVAGVHKLSAYSNITTAEMIMGKTIVNHDSKLDPRTAADYERSYVQYGEQAYVAVPLMREERWVASLWISDDQPRDWEKEDIDLLEGIAERTWTAAEKLRVDRALQDSEERLRVTFNTTVVGFATLQPDTHFIEVNDAYCKIVGYSREELLQMEYGSLVHPRFAEETRQMLAQLVAGEISSFIIEKIFVRRDGTEIWVQNSLSLVRDAEGMPLHLIAICQDVTERRRAEESLHQMNLELEERVKRRTIELQVANEFLRESEATSRLILESMPDAIVIIDRDGQIVHANTQVETLFGYAPGEVMGQPVEALVPQRLSGKHKRDRLSYQDMRNRRIMGLGHELFGRRKDESEFPVEVMLAPIDNSTNWDVLVAIRDNTRQREAQQALRINEEKLRTLFELLPVGVSFLNKEGKISELNNALTEILGLSKTELLTGRYQTRRYIRADGSPMQDSDFASTRARHEQKTVYNVETGIVVENGEIIWTSVNAAPVRVADIEAVVVTIDITERKKAEEALHKNRERLRILSRRLVEVQEEERHAIARELHDRVGQNLAALTLNLNILRNQLSSDVLEKVGTRLNDSVNLVKDILTITRSVMADLRPNVLDDYGLDAAINEYAERFTQRYGIRVVTHTPAKATPRLDPGVEMTLLRIAQEALTNIAKHAQASQAVMTLEMENDAALMTIEDNGLGILSWQKVNQPGSHGLRIMRERAEAFGGYLKIHSTYKNGTKIEVKIPLAKTTSGNERKEKKS